MKLSIPQSFRIYLVLMCLLAASLVLSQGQVTSEASRSDQPSRPQTVPFAGKVTARAAKRGNPRINWSDGRELETVYKSGPQAMSTSDSSRRPLALASADFDGDGFADLVIGYATSGGGAIALHRINPEALAPKLPETAQGIAELRYPSPFLPETVTFATQIAPDFIGVGDFNGDNFQDVVVASRGSDLLYLLSGDGHGNFSGPQLVELPGNVTAMLAQDVGLWKGATDLMIGIDGPSGPQLLVYSDPRGAWGATPSVYALPAEATALAAGNLDDRVTPDIVVAAGSQLAIVKAPAGPGEANQIERVDLPFTASAVQVGQFIFDRENKREIAALSTDGAIHILTNGKLDRRPYSQAEIDLMKRNHAKPGDEEGQKRFKSIKRTLINRPDKTKGWIEATSIQTLGGDSQLIAATMSNAVTDDLLVVSGTANQIQVVIGLQNQTLRDLAVSAVRPETVDDHSEPFSVDLDGSPIAALPMKLNLSTRNGLVVLQKGSVEPSVVLPVPLATFTVNTASDTTSCGAPCSLRGATIQSNLTAGPNQINIPAGTYTLSLPANNGAANAPFINTTYDDEWLFCNGWFEAGGDLDIGTNDVTINGTAGAGSTFIQSGTTATTTLTNVSPPANTDVTRDGNGIDRVFEVNDCGSPSGTPVSVTISNVTIRNGYGPEIPLSGGNFWETGGGVMFDGINWNTNVSSNKTLTLTNVTFSNNFAASEGGAVTVFNGALSVTGNTIQNNISYHSKGGGIAYAAATGGVAGETVTIGSTTISGNQSEFHAEPPGNAVNAAVGGGVWISQGLGVTINNTTHIDSNTADLRGGGLVIENAPTVAITGGSINSNTSKGDAGGLASDVRNAANAVSTITLSSVSITGNTSQTTNGNGDGGGIYNHFGNMTISGTTNINNNTAGRNGGGVYSTWTGNVADASAGFSMTNGTIGQTGSGNSAKNNGGGIAISPGAASSFGTISLDTVTIQANTANSDSSGGGDGGGIYIDSGTLNSLQNCTIDANLANSGGTGDGIKIAGGTFTASNTGTNNVNNGDSLSMTAGTFNTGNGTFNLTGNYNQSGGAFADGTGTLDIGGNFTFSGGTFTANSGTIVFNGSSAQTATGAVTFNNLTINNGTGVTLANSDTVNGTLTLTNGALGIGSTTLTLNGAVSFTSGTISSGTTGTVNYNKSTNVQNIAPGTYGNLTFSNFTKTLPNGATVSIASTFTPGNAVGHTITGSLVDFNGTGAQTIPAFNFNNLTISGNRTTNSVTLINGGTIGIAGTLSPTATFTSGNYIVTGNTVDFNGTGAQTVPQFNFNNLTISQARGVNSVTLVNGGTIGIAGTFSPTATFAGGGFVNTNNTIDFNGTGAQSVPAFNYNNLTISQARTTNSVTLVNGGTIGVAGAFSPTATFTSGNYIVTNNTFDFNGTGAQTVPQFNFNNLTISQARGANNVTLANGGTIGIAGAFSPTATFGGGGFVITNNTINFNGTGAQTVPAFNYNNLTLSNARTGANNITLVNGGTIGVAGTFSPTATFGTGNYVVTNNTFNFNGTGAQTVPAFNFNNLTISQARTTNDVTFVNGGTVKVAGTLTSTASFTSGQFVLTGNTIEYNGLSAQTLDSSFPTYNNLTLNNTAGTMGFSGLTVNGLLEVKAGTFTSATTYNNVQIDNLATLAGNGSEIDVSGNWTNNGTFTANASLVKFNGSGAQSIGGSNPTTFADLTIANSGNTVSLGINASVAGNLTVSSGTFDLGSFTANRTASGGQISVSNGATLKIGGSNTFPSNYTAHLLGQTSTVDYGNNSNLSQTISAENYGNLTCSGNGARVLANTGTVGIFTTFTPGTHSYTIAGSTIEYNSTTAPQTLPSSGFNTYNNLTINNTGGGVTGFSGLTVNGLLDVKAGTFTSSSTFSNVQIDLNATLAGTNATTMNVSGDWTNNGGSATSFTANGNTVNFNGAGAQTIGGDTSTTFNNLTINNSVTPVALGIDTTVNGTLTLTRDLNTSTFTLIEPVSAPASAGSGDVIGNVKRTNSPSALPTGTVLTFGNPFNTIAFDPATSLTPPTDVTFNLVKAAPGDFTTAVTRTYTISQTAGVVFFATLQLHYLDAELNGNNEQNLKLWREDLAVWNNQGAFNHDPVNNWVRQINVTQLSPWTLAADNTPTAANGDVSGRIADGAGNPVEGAAVRVSGTENRLTVTDANGNYHFDNVETNGFYTVTPSRANFTFSPAQRSFSQLGLHTDAAFGASATSTTLNPLDTSEYFVRQQYVDFLNREPDEAGLSFWVNNIESCATDQNCRGAKRIDTSAAFFLSIEFQQTGYLVDRTYKSAYGDMSNAPAPLKLSEFKPDTQEIGKGVVVNQSGWETVLENNKRAYVNEFVQRARFTAAYPTTLTPAEFVDKLFANAGVTPSASDRNAVINEFGSTTATTDTAARARALRSVAENSALAQKEFNSAFVLMQYFGYLQRDPNTGPDTNFDGYNFWLTKLNTFNGDFGQAEMVKAFLVAGEYRQRFPR